jgi:hypothetical protein
MGRFKGEKTLITAQSLIDGNSIHQAALEQKLESFSPSHQEKHKKIPRFN